jgi:hypothetical protein
MRLDSMFKTGAYGPQTDAKKTRPINKVTDIMICYVHESEPHNFNFFATFAFAALFDSAGLAFTLLTGVAFAFTTGLSGFVLTTFVGVAFTFVGLVGLAVTFVDLIVLFEDAAGYQVVIVNARQ